MTEKATNKDFLKVDEIRAMAQTQPSIPAEVVNGLLDELQSTRKEILETLPPLQEMQKRFSGLVEENKQLSAEVERLGQYEPTCGPCTCEDCKPTQIVSTLDLLALKARVTELEVKNAQLVATMAERQEPTLAGEGARLAQELWTGVCNCVFAQCGSVVNTETAAMREMRALIDHVCIGIDSPPAQQPLTLDQIYKHIGGDEGDREAVISIVREVEAMHGIGTPSDKPEVFKMVFREEGRKA